MKIVLSLVSSLNGKIDRGAQSDSRKWSSAEDAAIFTSLKSEFRLIVMGRKTYDVIKPSVALQPDVLRVVLTRTPDKYVHLAVPNQLEFTDEAPQSLIDRLEKRGYDHMLLAGGGKLNKIFFDAHLVDELHISLEPKLFGSGTNIVAAYSSDLSLQLVSVTKLNARGTLHIIYSVIK